MHAVVDWVLSPKLSAQMPLEVCERIRGQRRSQNEFSKEVPLQVFAQNMLRQTYVHKYFFIGSIDDGTHWQ